MGQRGAGTRAAGATERTPDVDRAPALQRLGRQADARRVRRADGRGRTARGARADLRCRNGRRGGGGPDAADIRAGVPRRLRRTLEADDARKLRAYRAALDTAGVRQPPSPGVRQPPSRCDRREGRAQLARRHRGHVSGLGALGTRGDVVDDEACGGARPAAGGFQPVQGTAAAQDRLRGALPDGRRVGRARSCARRRGSGSPGLRRRGALSALHGRAQVRGAAAQVGARPRRPRGAARLEDRSAHDLAGVSGPRRARGAAAAHQLPVGVRIALRRGPARRRQAARPCRHQDHLRLCAPCRGFRVRCREPGVARLADMLDGGKAGR